MSGENLFDPMTVDGDHEAPEMYERRERRAQPIDPNWGWSVGGRVLIPISVFPDDAVPVVEVPQLQIAFPKPGYYTVQFNLVQKTPSLDEAVLNPVVIRPQAEILWFVKGNYVRRVLNITDGMAISGTGESITINIDDESIIDSNGVEYEYDISVQVTPGTRPNLANSQPPIKNAALGFYGAGGPEFDAVGIFDINNAAVPPVLDNRTNIYIPQNCGINSYFLSIAITDPAGVAPAAGDFLIQQNAGAPGVAQLISIANYDSINRWNPVVPGAKIITITNRYQNINPTNVVGSIIFGVDG